MANNVFIGSGKIGSTIARIAISAGHKVAMNNSRGSLTLKELIDELGPSARAAMKLALIWSI